MSSDTYFLATAGQRTGPFSLEQVREQWRSGAATTQTLFWRSGMPEWRLLGELMASTPGGGPGLPVPPPPLPPGSAAAPYHHLGGGWSQGVAPQVSGLAITSLVLGVSSFVVFVTCVPAVICGHLALSRIKRSAGQLSGRGLAIGGLVLGYGGTLILALACLLAMAGIFYQASSSFSDRSQSTKDLARARQIGLAIKLYEADHDGMTPPDLDALFPKYLSDRAILVSALGGGDKRLGSEYLVPNAKASTLRPNTVMLRSVFATRHAERVLIHVDGSGEVGPLPLDIGGTPSP